MAAGCRWSARVAGLVLLPALLVFALPGTALADIPGGIVAGGNGTGSAANQFRGAQGLTVADDGTLYVSDGGNDRVQKWAPGATEGVTVAGGNGSGPAPDQLDNPAGNAIDGQGNIYIADMLNFRVQKWAPGAASGITVAGGNGAGSEADQLGFPTDVALDDDGNVYVADAVNNRVQKWAPGATSGVTVAGGNGPGPAANQLSDLGSLEVAGDGTVYIADPSSNRVQKWAPGATSGVTVAGGNGNGTAANQLGGAFAMTVDAEGNVFAVALNDRRMVKWAAGATSGVTLVSASGDNGPNDFQLIVGMGLDRFGNLYTVDFRLNRVQKWDPVPPVAAPTVSPPANAAGWRDGPATITWNWSDTGGTGLNASTCPATTRATATGNVTVSCADLSGNVATPVVPIKIDTVAPVAAPTSAGMAPNGTITWHWKDTGGSGLDPTSCASTSKVTGYGIVSATATCRDIAGNVGHSEASAKLVAAPSFTATPTTLAPGDPVMLTATGYLPGERVTLQANSTPVSLGVVTANATGGFTTTVTLPTTLTQGLHTITATGTVSGAPQQVNLAVFVPVYLRVYVPVHAPAPSQGSQLPDTGAHTSTPLLLGTALLVSGGLLLGLTRRSRPNPRS